MSRYVINNPDRLRALLIKDLDSAFQRIMIDIRNKLSENIEEHWYDDYEPLEYERTYEVLNSITGFVENYYSNIRLAVFFDTYKIIPRSSPAPRKWTSHRNITDGQDFNEGIIEVIERGNGGLLSNPRRNDHADMIERTRKWAAKHVTQELFREFGIGVSLGSFTEGVEAEFS